MIDIENELFNIVASHLRAIYPDIFVAGELVLQPPKFPAVMLYEADNQAFRLTQDSSSMENHARVVYTVEVYSNKARGKKAETRAIVSQVDEIMQGLGFSRLNATPLPNEKDPTIYRMVARYRGLVGKDKLIYRG